MITRKTGHLFYAKAYEAAEGSDNCNVCDGGNCDSCRTTYWVGDKIFTDLEEARAEENNEGKQLARMFPDLMAACERKGSGYPVMERITFTIKDGELYGIWTDYSSRQYPTYTEKALDVGTFYAELLEKYKEQKKKFDECACTDKHEKHYANSCCIQGCDDYRCYYEMKGGKRTEKNTMSAHIKWYM